MCCVPGLGDSGGNQEKQRALLLWGLCSVEEDRQETSKMILIVKEINTKGEESKWSNNTVGLLARQTSQVAQR